MQIKLFISDFDGVIYNFDKDNIQDGLYCNIKDKDPILYKNIKSFLFEQNKHIFFAWMRGWVNHNDLHHLIARKFNINVDFLDKELIDSIKKFELNSELLNFVKYCKDKGIKTCILTDNLSSFTEILVPYFKLDNFFDKIYSSADYHILKTDNNGKWIEEIIRENNILPQETLFIDDGEENIKNAKNKNINTYLYNSDTRFNFSKWICKNNII